MRKYLFSNSCLDDRTLPVAYIAQHLYAQLLLFFKQVLYVERRRNKRAEQNVTNKTKQQKEMKEKIEMNETKEKKEPKKKQQKKRKNRVKEE